MKNGVTDNKTPHGKVFTMTKNDHSNMRALLILCCLGFIFSSAKPYKSFEKNEIIVQDTTEIAIWKNRALRAEKERDMQKKIADKNFAKVNDLTQLLKDCNSKKN